MAVFDAPVCLTRSAPLEAYSGQLIFYDVMESTTIAASGVLSCVAEAGGAVVLPDAIRLPDFRTWVAAANANRAAIDVMSFTSICTVLKVADALDDAGLDRWINIAADRLTRCVHFDQETDFTPRQIAESLCMLSDSLQNRLLTNVAPDARKMHSLLGFLPSHMNDALIAASITPAKVLTVPLHDNSLPFVKALSATSLLAPHILSLSFQSPKDSPMQGQLWQEAAADHLSQALQHHSGITSLRLDTQYNDAASARMLAPAIATLTSLQTVYLHAGIDAATSSTLQQTLQALPQLEDLSLSLILAKGSLRRQRDGSITGTEQCCLAALLSPATQLTSLRIRARADRGKECYTAARPLVLPSLRHLSMTFEQRCLSPRLTNSYTIAACSLLSHLAAPLTSLDLQHGLHEFRAPLKAEDAPHAQRLISSLAKFPQLRRLSVTAPDDATIRSRAVMHAVTATAPPALAALRHLEHLNLAADLPAVLASLPLLATSLSHLRLTCRTRRELPGAILSHDTWQELLTAFCKFNLASLQLDADGLYSGLPGLARLRELTRLSALRVSGWECLSSGEDIAALASMTHLRKLHLISATVPVEMHERSVRAVAALSALTNFVYRAEDGSDDFLKSLITCAPAGLWPQLRQLGLDLWPQSTTPLEAFRFARGLPALTHLALDVPFDEEGDDLIIYGAIGDDVEALAAQADFAVEAVEQFPF